MRMMEDGRWKRGGNTGKAKGEGEVQDWRRNADAAKGEREIGWGLWPDSNWSARPGPPAPLAGPSLEGLAGLASLALVPSSA